MPDKIKKTIIVIAGPTASGKSALSINIAQQNHGVIINADSMQIYREMPILSARPSIEDERKVPHKLYGILSISENCSAARWSILATKEIENCFQNNKVPILVGGTGLYLKALYNGLSPIPFIPETVRLNTIAEFNTLGGKAFKKRLAYVDPDTAARLDETDSQRLIRAWEVYIYTGKPLFYYQSLTRNLPPDNWRFIMHILLPPRDILYNLINNRFEDMVNNGVMEEVNYIHNIKNINPNLSALKALGLPHLRSAIDGSLPMNIAIERAKAASRQYAKRQYTWFKNQLPKQKTDTLVVVHHACFGHEIPVKDII